MQTLNMRQLKVSFNYKKEQANFSYEILYTVKGSDTGAKTGSIGAQHYYNNYLSYEQRIFAKNTFEELYYLNLSIVNLYDKRTFHSSKNHTLYKSIQKINGEKDFLKNPNLRSSFM